MLVLTRKAGEQILIGEDITITVLEARGDAIKLGIDALRGMKIHRAEVLAAVAEANQQAAAGIDPAAAQALLSLLAPPALPAAPTPPDVPTQPASGASADGESSA